MKLTDEQRQALREATPGPIRIADPETGIEYVVVRAEYYDRMKAILDGYTRRAGWDDPALDIYEQYRKNA